MVSPTLLPGHMRTRSFILGAPLQVCRRILTSNTARWWPLGIAKLEFFAEDPGQLMTPRDAHEERAVVEVGQWEHTPSPCQGMVSYAQ